MQTCPLPPVTDIQTKQLVTNIEGDALLNHGKGVQIGFACMHRFEDICPLNFLLFSKGTLSYIPVVHFAHMLQAPYP